MAEILKNEKYDILDPIIEKMYVECVRLDNIEKKILVERFQQVIDRFVAKMRACDQTFNQIFNRINRTGSYFDGVRVGEATEFDLNLILKLNLEMQLCKKYCGREYVRIKIINGADCVKPIKNWIVNDFLHPARVKQWFEGVVTKTITDISGKIDDCQVRFVKSGPAMTLLVTSNQLPKKEISIDLVPAIEFPGTVWPSIPEKSKKLLNGGYGKSWFAVPKAEDAWRMSFPTHEKFIINDLKFFKYTLRLLKKVRDGLEINKVASYYIKTLFLWEVENASDRQVLWSKTRRGRLFMFMLVRFREALQGGRISYFWDKEQNLIGGLTDGYLKTSYHKLNNFINQIDKHANNKDASELTLYIEMALNKTKPQVLRLEDSPPIKQPIVNTPENTYSCILM